MSLKFAIHLNFTKTFFLDYEYLFLLRNCYFVGVTLFKSTNWEQTIDLFIAAFQCNDRCITGGPAK